METLAISSPIGVYEALAGPIIEFPLGTAVVLLMFGKYMERFSFFGRRITGWTGWLATAALARSFVAALVMLFELMSRPEGQREVTVRLFDWFEVGSFKAGISFLVDPLSATMCLVVTGVGTLIFLYSIGYMRGDDRYPVYFGYFSLFAASMLLLVLADNLALLYVGWEGVGLCSYLLIGYWFTRDSAANAAKKAFVVNRIGDFAFLIGIFLAFQAAGSVFFLDINHAAEAGLITTGIATAIALLVFAGATGKSAQIPLYVWLPDAMEGPTPVSALIHAATMVTAGVYVVARLAPVFDASGSALMVVAWIGALTALWAALMACAEYDIKRVLAYSTVSQIGYMFLAEGVGSYSVGIFHLVTH
ncbi:MAG TPA: NADH-quinone oxidoreductase subunit L, partial [Actinomycetota bacterium]|nr:NADH-quinone oxidoreductase subunit L [Actinomycetota bacterium]